MTVLRVDTIAGIGQTFGPLLDGDLEFNSQNYIVLPKGSSNQQGVLRTTEDVIGVGGTHYDNLVLAMPFNEATGFRDVSSRNRNPGNYGNVAISTAQSKYYGSSAYFDGSGDKLMITESSSDEFTFGTYDFTVEFFANPSNLSGSKCWITTADPINDEQGIWIGTSNTTLYWLVGNGTWFLAGSVGTISPNTWHHIALTRSGTTFRAFIDGIQVDVRNDSTPLTNTNNSISIGGRDAGAVQYSNGYLQDLRIYKGIAKYTADFTPPERIAETGVGFKTGALRYNTDSNKPELYDGNQWTELQISNVGLGTDGDTGPGARGVFGGGLTPASSLTIEYVYISSTGKAQSFGNLTGSNRGWISACASSTRGVWAAGSDNPGSTRENTIDYITISSTGSATSFGELIDSFEGFAIASCSNSTRGLWGSGYNPSSGVNLDTIQYITIASTGNAVDYGDLTEARRGAAACASSTRGLFGGGVNPASSNTIDFITISTLGSAQDFGDLTFGTRRDGNGSCSNPIRGIWAGGYNPGATNRIDYVTIATRGNAVNFGNLTIAKAYPAGLASPIRGVFGGGYNPSTYYDIIEYVNISTQGDAVDFGDLITPSKAKGGCSNAHGGL
jgi:hypothetical protein